MKGIESKPMNAVLRGHLHRHPNDRLIQRNHPTHQSIKPDWFMLVEHQRCIGLKKLSSGPQERPKNHSNTKGESHNDSKDCPNTPFAISLTN